MELLRVLGALAEPPCAQTAEWTKLLGLDRNDEQGPESALTGPNAVEHGRLFDFELYPFASIYLGPEGMLGGEARDRIAGFWRALDPVKSEPPDDCDHLSTLLATAAELAEAEEASSGQVAARWRHARRVFLWEHVLSWLPIWLSRVDRLGSPFYRRWGRLLDAALSEQAEALGAAESLPLALRSAPELADPRKEGGKVFLDQLLAPVRTGMIIARADLFRAARELGLGARIGERRYVLEALFSQAPDRLLHWLAREAECAAKEHRSRAEVLGEIAHFWQDRAESTACLLAELAGETENHLSAQRPDKQPATSSPARSSPPLPIPPDRPASGGRPAPTTFGDSRP